MTSFGGDVNMEGFEKRTQIVVWIFYAVLATVGLLLILGASSFKEEYAIRITFGIVLLLPLFFRFKKAVRSVEKEGGFKILQRLTPTEGGLVIIALFLGIAGVVLIGSALKLAPENFWARLALGSAMVGFAGGYIYQTMKIHKRRCK